MTFRVFEETRYVLVIFEQTAQEQLVVLFADHGLLAAHEPRPQPRQRGQGHKHKQ